MKNTNRLLILTIVFNFLILIEAGHGIAVLGLFELMGITETVQGNFKISLAGSYGDRLLSAAMIATVGQITLLVAYFKKAPVAKFIVTYVGIFLLLFSFSIFSSLLAYFISFQ